MHNFNHHSPIFLLLGVQTVTFSMVTVTNVVRQNKEGGNPMSLETLIQEQLDPYLVDIDEGSYYPKSFIS